MGSLKRRAGSGKERLTIITRLQRVKAFFRGRDYLQTNADLAPWKRYRVEWGRLTVWSWSRSVYFGW